jgi:hypothetical protein
MNALREALALLLGKAEPNPLQVTLPPERYVATTETLDDADLSTLQQRLMGYLGEVQWRYDNLVGTGWLRRLEQIATAEAGFLVDPHRPDPDPRLPQSAAADPGRRLRVPPVASSDTELGFALLAGQRTVDDLSLADARRAATELRNADSVCIRVLASRRAANLLGLPVSEVLALYRTEGDLQVPVSFASVRQRIPSTEPSPASSLTDLAQLIRQMVFLSNARELPPGELASRARHKALITWLLQLVGLDYVNARIAPLFPEADFVPQLVRFSAANAARVPAASTLGGAAEAEQRWVGLFGELKAALVRPVPDLTWTVLDLDPEPAHLEEGDAVRVAPADPVGFVAGVLAEGAAYLRRLGTADDVLMSNGDTPGRGQPDLQPLPAAHPLRGEFLGAGLAYFRYNLQVGARDRSPYQAGMISAVASAAKTQDSRYQPLRTAIQQSADLSEIARQHDWITARDAALIKDRHWESHLAPALRDPAHPERARRLAEFIGSATTAHWGLQSFARPPKGGKGSPRGNASRYQQLLNFYGRLEHVTDPPGPP